MNRKLILMTAAACLLAGACAKNQASTTGQDAQKYLQLWMEKYHPGIAPTEDGLYLLAETPGTGLEWTSEAPYVLVRSTIRTLGGTVSTTTDEELSKQLGTYVKGNYYGPKYQLLGENYSYAGLDALVSGMRIGGTRKAVIPAWMLTSSRYNTQKEYLDACTSSTHLLYEITLESFTTDPEQTAKTQLSTFIHNNFSDADNVSYVQDQEPDGTFWFSSDVSSFKEEDALETGATIKINYTGRLLDGTVFDTTLEKVAKDAGIYSASRTYEPQRVSLASTYSDITMGGSSSLINGFKGALYLMHWKGQKANALFTSSHGYSSSGSGSSIPGYASLWFELEIVE